MITHALNLVNRAQHVLNQYRLMIDIPENKAVEVQLYLEKSATEVVDELIEKLKLVTV